ncbi:hypothetical protein VCHENC02_1357A, partial [Vibrio harveyi]
MFHVGLRNSI